MSPYFIKNFFKKNKNKNALKKEIRRIASTFSETKYFLRYLPLIGGMGRRL
jgi:hypothetical protein